MKPNSIPRPLRDRVHSLEQAIDHAYESGTDLHLEEMEVRLECLLESLECQLDAMEEGETWNLDADWPDPVSQIVDLACRYARDRGDSQSLADFIRAAFAGEGPWTLLPGITDCQILSAAEDAMSTHKHRIHAMRSTAA